MLSYCFLFFRQFLVPCFYGLLVLIYWGSICKVVQTMSLACLIILIFGIENSLLPCRLFMAYHKSSYLAITILLLLTQFLKATVELVHSENDCDFQSMNLFKQIFQEVTYFSFTLFLVINLFSYVLIYTIMLMSGILAAKNILELYPEEEEQHHGEQTNSNIAQPPQEVRVPEGDQQVCSICLEQFAENANNDGTLLRLHCGHKFHQQCIQTWLQEHHICPYCRREVRSLNASGQGLEANMLIFRSNALNYWVLPEN